MGKGIAPLAPPNPPWREIPVRAESGGYLGYVYNDDMSALPVRAVTKVGDNKADPNTETMTYGLFSTCGLRMRRSIVKRGCRHLFFTTRRGKIRVLTGLYFVRWYATISSDDADFCLAADKVRFVADPIPLSVVDETCGTRVSRPFRPYVGLDIQECRRLEGLLMAKPNALKAYVVEIDRLERFNLRHGGYRYVTGKVKEAFSWRCRKAKIILKKAAGSRG